MPHYFPFPPPKKLTSDEGHYATVTKVEKGRYEGKWELKIERPGQKPKIFHTTPTNGGVRMKMAKYLGLPLSSIFIHVGDPNKESPTDEEEEETMPSTPIARDVKIPSSLTTKLGHHGTVSLSPSRDLWDLKIEGPVAPGALSTMTVTVSSNPTKQEAAQMVAKILDINQDSIQFQYDTEAQGDTHAPVTPLPSDKPLDKFEFSPNGRATCHECHERIGKHSERVGIQEWNARYKHWRPVYYHRECCTNDMLQSLELGSGKRKLLLQHGDSDTSGGSIEKKLKAEIDRQEEQTSSKRRLVYGERLQLQADLRRLRSEFADQLEMEPYKVFNDETLDDIVEKLPSTEKELIKCRGIAQKRCDRYGGVILQLVSQYQNDND